MVNQKSSNFIKSLSGNYSSGVFKHLCCSLQWILVVLFSLNILSFTAQSVQSKSSLQSCYDQLLIENDLMGNIIPISKEDHLLKDRNGRLVFYYGDDQKSYWYKIKINRDCRISFFIEPSEDNNRYNFFMYKNPKTGSFCENVVQKQYIPLRTNLMKEGGITGLHQESSIDSSTTWQELYSAPFHKPIYASKGDEYYLNVYHVSGNDCGHILNLQIDSISQSFFTIRKNCYDQPLLKIPPIVPTMNARDTQLTPSFKNKFYVRGIVLDSITKNTIKAKIKWKDAQGKDREIQTNDFGEYELILEGKIFYELTCHAVGYSEKTVKLMKQNLGQELKHVDFKVKNIEAGKHFVLKDIHFHSGTYAFRKRSYGALGDLLVFMKRYNEAKIEIQGHTNGKGFVKQKYAPNAGKEWQFTGNEKKLSKKRAEAVKEYLVKNGIENERITIKGYGAKHMLYKDPRNQFERDMNKRVEIVLLEMGRTPESVMNETW